MIEKDRGKFRICVAILPQLVCDGVVRRRGGTVVFSRELHGFGCHLNDPSRRARDIAPLEQGDMVDEQACGVRAELFLSGPLISGAPCSRLPYSELDASLVNQGRSTPSGLNLFE